MLVPLKVRFFLENVNLLQGPRLHVRALGPHIAPPKGDGNPFPVVDVIVRKVTVHPPTRHVKPQVFKLFVGVGAAGDEHPLITLEVIRPSRHKSRFHPIQVLEGPERQLCNKVLRPENEAANQDVISIGIEMHQGHVESCKRPPQERTEWQA